MRLGRSRAWQAGPVSGPWRLLAAATVAVLGLAGCGSAPPDPGPQGILATITTPPPSVTLAPRPTPTTTTTSTSAAAENGWYLALGDSLAAGNQPGGDQKDRGYAGPVLEGVRQDQPGTQLRNLGCSGETTTTMIQGGRSCPYPEGSQVKAAVAFLKANAGTTRLVTLDIGANNVLQCGLPTVDLSCATTNTATVAKELTGILGQLHTAAPKVPIVVLTYYNPGLAAWAQSPNGRAPATQSQPAFTNLNAEIAKSAKTVGAKVADVAGAFASTDTSGTPLPTNVQRICDWTWMCKQSDIHANDDGYAAMAKAVLAAR
jgi:lysophospholipase L1-like esterase